MPNSSDTQTPPHPGSCQYATPTPFCWFLGLFLIASSTNGFCFEIGKCYSYDATIQLASQLDQKGILFGNFIALPQDQLDKTIDLAGQKTTIRKLYNNLEELSLVTGYKSFVEEIRNKDNISTDSARDRADNLYKFLLGKYMQSAGDLGTRRFTISSNQNASVGYLMIADKPLGTKPTHYCVKAELTSIRFFGLNNNKIPANLRNSDPLSNQAQFQHVFRGFDVILQSKLDNQILVIDHHATHFGNAYIEGRNGLKYQGLLEKLDVGPRATDVLRPITH